MLSCGKSSNFLVSLNFDRASLFYVLLPYFEEEQPRVNFRSLYRTGPKVRERPPSISSPDLLGMALWYLKSTGRQQSICPLFGLIPSSVNVWLDYGLQVLLYVVKRKSRTEFSVHGPTEAEMKASADNIKNNRPNGRLLKGVFAVLQLLVVDSGRIPCADYLDPDLQN